jgi:hypothetical protein
MTRKCSKYALQSPRHAAKRRPDNLTALFLLLLSLGFESAWLTAGQGLDQQAYITYLNELKPCSHPSPLMADFPEFIEPINVTRCFEAPGVVNDHGGDLMVRSWHFSYQLRGVIEMENRLRAAQTALIVVHPWGIDDGQGWRTPEPNGAADFGTPEKNLWVDRHEREVLNPFVKSLRGKVKLVMYTLPGREDPIRKKLYHSTDSLPTEAERRAGAKELAAKLNSFSYRSVAIPAQLQLSANEPLVDYFRRFPGGDAGPGMVQFPAPYDPPGFWDLPIPVSKALDVAPSDVVVYDQQGYEALKDFLHHQGIRHILLCGYDILRIDSSEEPMIVPSVCPKPIEACYHQTIAGADNLSRDFDVFMVGDASLALFPSNATPRFETNGGISYAAVYHMITQISWIKLKP